MNSLFGAGTAVSFARVMREHRAALAPLAIILAINALVLGFVVYPLSQRVASNQSRADATERTQAVAATEFKQAESIRDGKARASTDLEKFYKEVLPTDVAAARRMTHLRFQQKAREHGVQFQRGATSEEEMRESSLDRLTVSMTLSGDYDDIRALIYDLETSPDFFVIDNMALTEGGDQSAPLTLAMEVSTYFRTARVPVARAETMAAERRTLWLGAALIVGIGALVVVRSMDDPRVTPTRRNAAGRTARVAAQDANEPAPGVNLDHLARTRDEPADSARNPFRFRPRPAPPPPPAPVAVAPPPGKVGSIGGPVAPAPPPGPPPITLKFIGIVEKADGTRIAVLSDGKRPYYGVEGQEIEGQYKILKVGLESLEIAYIDGRGRQTLRLSGQ